LGGFVIGRSFSQAAVASGEPEDFVGAEIPRLAGVPRVEQLKHLKWLMTVPERTHALFPALSRKRGEDNRDWRDRERESHRRIAELAQRLEEKGYRADAPPPGTVAARVEHNVPEIVVPALPPPVLPMKD